MQLKNHPVLLTIKFLIIGLFWFQSNLITPSGKDPFPTIRLVKVVYPFQQGGDSILFSNDKSLYSVRVLGREIAIYQTENNPDKIQSIVVPKLPFDKGRAGFVPFNAWGWSLDDQYLVGWFNGLNCPFPLWETEIWIFRRASNTHDRYCIPTVETEFRWTPFSSSILYTDRFNDTQFIGFDINSRKQFTIKENRVLTVQEIYEQLDTLIADGKYLWDRSSQEVRGWVAWKVDVAQNKLLTQLYLCPIQVKLKEYHLFDSLCYSLLNNLNYTRYQIFSYKITSASNVILWQAREINTMSSTLSLTPPAIYNKDIVLFATDISTKTTREIARWSSLSKQFGVVLDERIDIPISGNFFSVRGTLLNTPTGSLPRYVQLVVELNWEKRLPPPNVIIPTYTPAPTSTHEGPFG
jgi:hypothetical protein